MILEAKVVTCPLCAGVGRLRQDWFPVPVWTDCPVCKPANCELTVPLA